MTNVLKKLTANPLTHFHLWEEVEEYEGIQNDEQLAAFYHKMLNRFGSRSLILSFLYAMIGHSTGKNTSDLLKELDL